MPARSELKRRGKAAMKANYWKCVLTAFVLTVATGVLSIIYNGGNAASEAGLNLSSASMTPETIIAIATAAGVGGGLTLVGLALDILVFNPLEVGAQRFYLENSRSPASLSELLYGFKENYGGAVLTLFLRDLFTILWTCLFIIPGIVKFYSYRMVPYILAEDATMTGTDAITLSRHMMKGHKFEAFVLDLSFILWWLLAAITFGIAGIFWTGPYAYSTNAEYYKEVSREFENK